MNNRNKIDPENDELPGFKKERTAKEFLLLLIHAAKLRPAWQPIQITIDSSIDPADADNIVEKFFAAFERPEKKRKTYAEDFLEKMPNARRKDGVPLTCRGKAYGKPQLCKAMTDDDCLSCWNAEMEDEAEPPKEDPNV